MQQANRLTTTLIETTAKFAGDVIHHFYAQALLVDEPIHHSFSSELAEVVDLAKPRIMAYLDKHPNAQAAFKRFFGGDIGF